MSNLDHDTQVRIRALELSAQVHAATRDEYVPADVLATAATFAAWFSSGELGSATADGGSGPSCSGGLAGAMPVNGDHNLAQQVESVIPGEGTGLVLGDDNGLEHVQGEPLPGGLNIRHSDLSVAGDASTVGEGADAVTASAPEAPSAA